MVFHIISGIFLLLGSLIGADASCKSSPCIDVDIYYESQCRDSMRFIKNQLAPSYPAFKDHLNINFVPYGKASHTRYINDKWIFRCQHGSSECEDNKAQACALDVIKETSAFEKKQEDSVKLIDCAMSYISPLPSVSECANNIGLSEFAQQKIIHCIQTSAGDDLLAAHGDKTHSLQSPLQFVPTIIIHGVYSYQQPHAAFYNFAGFICNLIWRRGKNLSSCAQFNRTQ